MCICIYFKNQIKAKNCCSKTCCCCKNKYIKEDKEDNKNQINNFGGVTGLIGILENNKVSFNINTSSGLKKIAETVEVCKGEFNYENVKKLKIILLGLELEPDTIEKYIDAFSCNLKKNEERSFLKGKLIKAISNGNDNQLIYNFNNSRYYLLWHDKFKRRLILNVNQQTKDKLNYGIYFDGTYLKFEGTNIYSEPERQEDYKKGFLEGK